MSNAVCEDMKSDWIAFMFAEDLVTFLQWLANFSWHSSFEFRNFRHLFPTTFTPETGRLVHIYCNKLNQKIQEFLEVLKPIMMKDHKKFTTFMFYLADQLFRGDVFEDFLFFCAIVIYIASYFISFQQSQFGEYAIVVIASTFNMKLKSKFFSKGGWTAFQKVVQGHMKS